jgi:hypothetical protein
MQSNQTMKGASLYIPTNTFVGVEMANYSNSFDKGSFVRTGIFNQYNFSTASFLIYT